MTHPGENTAPIQSADLSGIIERLQNATGPDREIDAILEHSVYCDTPHLIQMAIRDGWDIPAFTGSVDAAIALAERVLPGRSMMFGKGQTAGTKPWARVGAWPDPDATGANLPIAICVATLRRLQSKGEA